ncbi:M24 family metallopeptidase [Streptomyces sp. NPDC001939]|uniref:M24 family metallopeptidase n=1 Tax=Streptomyces TaxID=1883 RepID=UPI001D0AA721|nr:MULTISPECIES: M24 family metallopeptidase [Streptomyces]MCX5086033.1 aminopeptidase P family protein [Streptomyces sp. NBC_00401]UDM02890.1 aminopeptidase P family protein [Streptomyces longhuiensis]
MAAPDRMDERLRALGLVEGQRMAQALFAEVAARGLIVPGRSEREVSDRIGALAREAPAWGRCGSWWVVRSGPHSALPAAQEPPEDRIITEDDMVIVDLGPLLAGYESGFVRTVATGRDPHKRRLAEDLPRLFTAAREVFHTDRTLTGSHLHAEIQTLATKAGWTLAGRNAGHTVGTDADDAPPEAYITPADDRPAGPLAAGDQPARRARGLRRLAQGAPRPGVTWAVRKR